MSGGSKKQTQQSPPINASSKDEENFITYARPHTCRIKQTRRMSVVQRRRNQRSKGAVLFHNRHKYVCKLTFTAHNRDFMKQAGEGDKGQGQKH